MRPLGPDFDINVVWLKVVVRLKLYEVGISI